MQQTNNTKNILMFSRLNIWSMDENKGAPSFNKTIQGYLDADWKLTLIAPSPTNNHYKNIPKLNAITFKPLFGSLLTIPKIGYLINLLNIKFAERKFYSLGKKILKKNKDNTILYAYEVHGVNAVKKLSKKFHIPMVTRFQGTVLAPVKNTFLNRIVYYPHFSALKTKANVTIMTDDGTLGDKVLENIGNKSEHTCFWRNGVDIDFIHELENERIISLKKSIGLAPNEKMLLTISRLAGWKRVERAIDALYQARKKNPAIKLVIVGDGDQKEYLKTYVQKLNITSNVIFAGAIPHNEIKNYLALADIFLSLYDLSNVGNPLLEAMSAGKPIITLNVGATNTLIKHNINGVLLDLNQLDKIPDYIIKICNDKEYASLLGNSAREYAINNFLNWDERIKKEIEVVSDLVSLD